MPAAPVAPAAPYEAPQPSAVRTTGCVASYETAQSHVDICGSAGSLYYYGSSDSGSITLRAYPSGSGYATESNDRHVYRVDDSALTIARQRHDHLLPVGAVLQLTACAGHLSVAASEHPPVASSGT
ncbi:hypothetical protein E1181_25260 [Saccharopolyspora terrae]|uniref:Uncharacterized protein n=1 Tax=Saccharopolyspora terrae TaxID=2530384 RepID=A0A4V6PCJ4_9PSEU|nr:hypothetical protein [Saccharopolyspora terrae]TDD01406.1 hypothetical protein E1181_25260 [Saccharopolyspora terrae]